MAKHKTPNPAPITNGCQDSCTGMKSPEVIASKYGSLPAAAIKPIAIKGPITMAPIIMTNISIR